MEETFFFTDPYSIGYNIAGLLFTFIILFIIEGRKKHRPEEKVVLMPIDKNRGFIASVFYFISGMYLLVALISFSQYDFTGGIIGLVNTGIWVWFPTLSIRQTPSNQFGERRSLWTKKPSSITTEGTHLSLIFFYEWIISEAHGEEPITDQKINHTCTVDSLKGSDDWMFVLEVTFPYKWITANDRVLEIRNFTGGSGGQTGIIERVCDILENSCQDVDDSYALENIDKEQCSKEAFKKEIEDTFSERVRLSGLPLEILTNELFTIKIKFSPEYLTAVQKVKTAEKEGQGRRTLTLAEQQTVLQMKKNAEDAGTNLPYEYWEDIYLRKNNQADTKYIFEGIDPKKISPVVSIGAKKK